MKDENFQQIEVLSGPYGQLNYYSLRALQNMGYEIEKLPFSIRILLENTLRNFDAFSITKEHILSLCSWNPQGTDLDIPFKPSRVLMQDFTGVPAVVDIASIRAEMARKGKDPSIINPLIPVDLVVDHSVQVDFFGADYAYEKNMEQEYDRNVERYEFLKWAQQSLDNFNVVPPGMGICHQVNLEYLAKGVVSRNGEAFPDTLVGTDSHTPMVNGIGVLGWGVGGIEAEAALLGQPIYFLLPQVVGLELSGKLRPGISGTDLVLTITRLLRDHGVIGKFVEVYGPGVASLTVPDRASIGNMSPEFGCTVTFFPVDELTLTYMESTGRDPDQIALTRDYCKANLLWRDGDEKISYSSQITLDLNSIEPTVSGPKRPQDKILLKDFKTTFLKILNENYGRSYHPSKDAVIRWKAEGGSQPIPPVQHESSTEPLIETKISKDEKEVWINLGREKFRINDGTVVIAAITSCTNTSNPYLMIGAGLVARKATQKGIKVKPWVKTSLAPGSKVVTTYLQHAGLMQDFQAQNFHTVGFGCTSCIGNSGPLAGPIASAIDTHDLVVAAVLSGNRNFEARIHPQVKMNFLMSPMLVVAYAIAGRVDIDLAQDPIAFDVNDRPVFFKDIMPSGDEINKLMAKALFKKDFIDNYNGIFKGNARWQGLSVTHSQRYEWDPSSTYIKEAPFFRDLPATPPKIKDFKAVRVILLLGDSVTTDHISPAGSFKKDSPAGRYLTELNVRPESFNSYGSRRGNDELMVRGTFANVRIKNALANKEGGFTRHLPSGEELPVYDAAMRYKQSATPLIVIAGKEYGSGSSRDWAAKGTFLLGIKMVLAESYERIHRSNLVGMGVLPLQFRPGQSAITLGITGLEVFELIGLEDTIQPGMQLTLRYLDPLNQPRDLSVKCRLDSSIEIEYYRNGGILQYVMRQFLKS